MLALVHWCRGNPGAARRTTVGKVSAGTGASPASTEERLLLEEPRSENRLALNAASSSCSYNSPWVGILLLRRPLVGLSWSPFEKTFGGLLEHIAIRDLQWTSMGYYSSDILSWGYPGTLEGPFLRRKHITFRALWHLEWTLATACEWGGPS